MSRRSGDRVTIAGLADQLELSKASVSYALNGQPGVSDETRRRVLELRESSAGIPSSSARALSRSRTDAIGIVLRRDPEPARHRAVLHEPARRRRERSRRDRPGAAAADGRHGIPGRTSTPTAAGAPRAGSTACMLFDLAVDDPRPPLLDELGLAFVLHGARRQIAPGRVLVYDVRGDAQLIVDHLAALGHRRMLHMTGPLEFEHEHDRRDAVDALGAPSTDARASFARSDYSTEEGERIAPRQLRAIRRSRRCHLERSARAGRLAALERLGRDDVALVSWDDSLLCRLGSPPDHGARRFPEEQGRAARSCCSDNLRGLAAEEHARPAERTGCAHHERPGERTRCQRGYDRVSQLDTESLVWISFSRCPLDN